MAPHPGMGDSQIEGLVWGGEASVLGRRMDLRHHALGLIGGQQPFQLHQQCPQSGSLGEAQPVEEAEADAGFDLGGEGFTGGRTTNW